MSLDLDIRLYPTTNDFSAVETFCCLVEAIAGWNQLDGPWSSFTVGKGRSHNTISHANGPLTSAEVVRLASRCRIKKECRIGAYVPIRCWRYTKSGMISGDAILDIHCWDKDTHALIHGDMALEGIAAISLNPANPFFSLLDETSAEGGREYNERVAENLDALGELFVKSVKATRPHSAKMFVDRGWRLPINSHCTYFSSAEAVIEDLNLIARVWKEGLPAYRVPPLENYDEAEHEWALSSLRPSEQRRSLWTDLRDRLPALNRVSPKAVEIALQETCLDIHRLDGGFVVFDYPYFLNSFVAPFYLDVLDSVSPETQ